MNTYATPTNINKELLTALQIARQFCRDAVWAQDRVNWVGASQETINNRQQVIHRSFGPDLYTGISGIALFLAEVLKRFPDPIIKSTLAAAVKTIQLQLQDHQLDSYFGLYTGYPGIGYALWKIGKLTQDQALVDEGVSVLLRLEKQEIPEHELDIIAGPAGAIPVLLKIYHAEQQPKLLAIAKRCGEYLVKKAVVNGPVAYWELIPGHPGLTGYSHGAAGVALALLELFAVTKEEKYRKLAYQGFQYETIHFVPEQQNWPDLRNLSEVIPDQQGVVCGTMWCHGAPGIGLSRLRAYELTHDQRFLREAAIAFQTTWKSVETELQQPASSNFSLCHGLAGNADILLSAALGLQSSAYFETAKRVGQAGNELYNDRGVNWPSGVNNPMPGGPQFQPTPGLMLGQAGVGYFYLRLALPSEIENLLLIH